MKRKSEPIVLSKLVHKSAAAVSVMAAELCNGKADKEPSRWGRRFAASGKSAGAPKLRQR